MGIEARIEGETPFADPSGAVLRGHTGDQRLRFLARHGAGHRRLSHGVNHRANIFALKPAGVTRVLGRSAVGHLAQQVAPGDLALPEQCFDQTRGAHERTLFGGGVAAHVANASPVRAAWVNAAATSARCHNITLHCESALLTPDDAMTPDRRQWLAVLRQ